ncbi:Zn-ribbon domain-containing OB-fold protein [Gulosibacter sp. 10]|uniref:Zn-ribbon domain-containing OB-fold protein n=1 Tax=Gulosibacter sp. 10 TaxID=1255570 RepID=UPI001C3D8307|nr:OB-fold domain-containing protein [Gulosibacter sp. 10]
MEFSAVLEPIEDLGTEAGVRLLVDDAFAGGRCRDCGDLSVPRAHICRRCRSVEVEAARIGGRGLLYSYTRVHVAPKCAAPYCLGYVDLVSGVRVLGRLEMSESSLACDIPVRAARTGAGEEEWAFVEAEDVRGDERNEGIA